MSQDLRTIDQIMELDTVEAKLEDLRSKPRKLIPASLFFFSMSIGGSVLEMPDFGDWFSWISIYFLVFGLITAILSLLSLRDIRVLKKEKDQLLEGSNDLIRP